MASMVVNAFGLRSDIQAYHLGGMGCANGVVAVNMVADLLAVSRAGGQAVVRPEDRRLIRSGQS